MKILLDAQNTCFPLYKRIKLSLAIYPDGYATQLRETLAAFLQVDLDEIILGNGSDNLIQIISRALLHPNASTIMATPTFSQYKHNAVIEGAVIREIPLINGDHDLDAMLKAIDETDKCHLGLQPK